MSDGHVHDWQPSDPKWGASTHHCGCGAMQDMPGPTRTVTIPENTVALLLGVRLGQGVLADIFRTLERAYGDDLEIHSSLFIDTAPPHPDMLIITRGKPT